jgi:hypothetical protein
MLHAGYRAEGGREPGLEIDVPTSLTALVVAISTVTFLSSPLMYTSNTHEAVVTALEHIYSILGLKDHQNETYGKTDKTLFEAFCLAAIGGIQYDPSNQTCKRLDRSGIVKPGLFGAWMRG